MVMGIVLDLVITLISYGIIPLLIANSLTTRVTTRRYRVYSFLGNILVMVLFIIFNGRSTGAPYLLWTSIFSYVGNSILKERNLIADTAAPKQSLKLNVTPDMYKFVCDECNTPAVSWYNECPNCHAVGKMRKGTDEEIRTWNNLTLENTPVETSSQDDIVVEEKTEELNANEGIVLSDNTEDVPIQNNNGGSNMYCKYCGTEHAAQQKYCAVCGKALQEEDKSKKKKPIATIVLSCLTGLFAIATVVLGFSIPRQYQAGYTAGYIDGDALGYEEGYTKGIEEFDEGYALGWMMKEAVIDADIAQTSEYKSWAKAYPELGRTDVDSELKAIYNVLHTDIDNWYEDWEKNARDRIADSDGDSSLSLVEFSKYLLLSKILPYTIDAMHNVVDNLMLLENDHLEAKSFFNSAYRKLEVDLKESGIFSEMTRYEEWLSTHPEK